ncbi:hypothetical protein ACFFX1_11650 [Dactylosporangium sucinum]|uniref:VWFA domain-containing protein n=1 Tax=Dactylosporangium sucinum TaxID=1424081 RepID=A0A917TLV4_9ACTN|nr:hypothetical protein [Dactylosporangium sucinum]GGM27972.1 hypothetical protein GCM10007977_031620 [Dactylosporangium sucinum]
MTTQFDNPPAASVRTYLIYVVLDTSESMRVPKPGTQQRSAPLDHFIDLFPRMIRELAANPVTNNLAAVSVLAFNDDAEVLRPMTPLDRAVPIGKPRIGFGTDYAGVLKFLVAQHVKDVRAVKQDRSRDGYNVDVARPWIFFVTDGRPFAHDADQAKAEWMQYREQLTDPPTEARIVAIGLPGADEDVLWWLATGNEHGLRRNAFISDQRRADPKELSVSVVDAIKSSISASARTGLLSIRTPVGMRRIDGPTNG